MLTRRLESRSTATLSSTRSSVAPGTNRCTTLRVTGHRSAVRRSPSDRLAERIAGRSVLVNKPDITAPGFAALAIATIRWGRPAAPGFAALAIAPSSLRRHVRIVVIGGRDECLLDRA